MSSVAMLRTVGPLTPQQYGVDQVVESATIRVSAERQRIAGLVHDEVSPHLFALVAEAMRAADSDRPQDLHRSLGRVVELATTVSDRLRDVLRDCSPVEPLDGIPAATGRDLDDFTARSGIAAELVVRGRPWEIAIPAARALLACLRQALHNVERHADAHTVLVTLDYQPDLVTLTVLDDGRGLPTGFELCPLPDGGRRWGLASMVRQVEQCGGTVELSPAEDGGARVRVRLPR